MKTFAEFRGKHDYSVEKLVGCLGNIIVFGHENVMDLQEKNISHIQHKYLETTDRFEVFLTLTIDI